MYSAFEGKRKTGYFSALELSQQMPDIAADYSLQGRFFGSVRVRFQADILDVMHQFDVLSPN